MYQEGLVARGMGKCTEKCAIKRSIIILLCLIADIQKLDNMAF